MATVPDQVRPIALPKHEAFLEEQLGRALRRVRTFDVAAGVLGFLAGTLLYGLGMMLLDRWLEFSGLTRLLALGGYAVVALAYAARFIVRPMIRHVNPYYAALRVEHVLPGAKNSIINWLDLRGRKLPPAIRSAVGNRAAHDLAAADIDQAISGRRVFYLGGVTVAVFVATLVVLTILKPTQFFSLFGRAFAPFGSSGITTQTDIQLLEPAGGNVTVPVNQPINFRVRVDRKIPQAGKPDSLKLLFRYSQEDTVYQERALEAVSGNREWEVRLPGFEVKNGFWYKITGGDAETAEYRVTARALPAIERFEVVYKYRPYLHRKDRSDTSPTLQELRGTEVFLTARTNRNVTDGLLHFEGDGEQPRPIKAELLPNQPDALRFHFVLDKDALYRIRFRSTGEEESGDSIAYQIRVQPDLPPRVVLTKPGEDVTLPADGTLALEGTASDDFGLTDLTLRLRIKDGDTLQARVYRGDEKKPGQSPFRFADGRYPLKLDYKDFVNLAELKTERGERVKLRPKMVIEYWLEATDNCDYPQANVGRTERTYLVTIADPPADPKQLQEERKQQEAERKKLEQEQEQHKAKQNQELKKEEKDRKQAGDKPEAKPEKDPLEEKAEQIRQKLERERDQGELKKDQPPPEAGKEKEPGKQDNPNQPPGEGKTPPKEQPKDAPGDRKPDDKDAVNKPTPQDQKAQPKPEAGKPDDPNKNAGDQKPQGQGPPDDKKAGDKKQPGDAQKAGGNKPESAGKPGEKPGDGKKDGQAQGAGDQANAKPSAEVGAPGVNKGGDPRADKGVPKPDGEKGKPTGDVVKGNDKKDGSGNKNDRADKKTPPSGDLAKATGDAKPEGDSSAGNQKTDANGKPGAQQNATKDDVAAAAKDLQGATGQQRKNDVQDLQDMAANARDPQVREAARDALKQAGEPVTAGGGRPEGDPQEDNEKRKQDIDAMKNGLRDELGKDDGLRKALEGAAKDGDLLRDLEMTPEEAKKMLKDWKDNKTPDAEKKKKDLREKFQDGEMMRRFLKELAKDPELMKDLKVDPAIVQKAIEEPQQPQGVPELEAMQNDLRDREKAGDLQLRAFAEAFKNKDFLKKLDMTPAEADRYLKALREQREQAWAEERKELDDMAKSGAAPYSSGPRTLDKPKGPSKDPLQRVAPLLPTSEFEKSYREFTQELSRMKPKKEKN